MIKVNKVRLKGLAFHAYSFFNPTNYVVNSVGNLQLVVLLGQIWESEIYREQSIIQKGSQEKNKNSKNKRDKKSTKEIKIQRMWIEIVGIHFKWSFSSTNMKRISWFLGGNGSLTPYSTRLNWISIQASLATEIGVVLLECAICSHTLLALFKVSHALSYTNLRNQSEDKRPIVSIGSNLVTLKFVFHHSKIVVLP